MFPSAFSSSIHFAPDGWAGTASDRPSPTEALRLMQEGNRRFLAGQSELAEHDLAHILEHSRKGQQPLATVLGCSDSRVPLELVLDQHIGDLFVIRVAGNVVRTATLGTIEYGVDALKTPLLVVMGHTHCGACTAVANGDELGGHIPQLVAPIGDALAAVRQRYSSLEGEALLNAVIEENVWQSIEDMLRHSSVVRGLVRNGSLKVKGAVYDIESGAVKWLGPHPRQNVIIAELG
ncbi:MAG: carbonic anhydrase [Planctomycetales bacterium]|nr:carbonic anhydrase [bacterium]UNM07049.1 MAG: carbonic anhydrase [Planctomycetales bacterium]